MRSLLKRSYLAITEDALWDLVERLRRPFPLRKWQPERVIPWPAPPLPELEAMALPVYRLPKVLPWMGQYGWDPVTWRWADEAEPEGKAGSESAGEAQQAKA